MLNLLILLVFIPNLVNFHNSARKSTKKKANMQL